MTKKEHIQIVSMASGLKKSDVEKVIDAHNENIMRQVSQGVRVYMNGFGTFTNHYRRAITTNLPKRKGVVTPATLIPRFNPSPAFMIKVSKPKSAA